MRGQKGLLNISVESTRYLLFSVFSLLEAFHKKKMMTESKQQKQGKQPKYVCVVGGVREGGLIASAMFKNMRPLI